MKTISSFTLLFLTCGMQAQVLMVDSFNYPTATILGGNGGWMQSSPLTTGATMYNEVGLVYPSYSDANSGCAQIFTNGSPGDLVYKSVGSSINTGALYVSFLIQITAAPTSTSNPYCIALGDQSTFSYGTRLLVRQGSTPNFVNFGTRKATGSDAWSAVDYPLGSTHLVVLKYVFNDAAATDDNVQMFVNPASLNAEPASPSADASSGSDFTASFVHFVIRNNGGASGPTAKIDEIHIARTWAQLFDGSVPATVSIIEQTEINIYPNPAINEIYFGTSLFSYTIFNAEGQMVMRGKGQWADIAALPAGIYSIRIQQAAEDQEITSRFIKR